MTVLPARRPRNDRRRAVVHLAARNRRDGEQGVQPVQGVAGRLAGLGIEAGAVELEILADAAHEALQFRQVLRRSAPSALAARQGAPQAVAQPDPARRLGRQQQGGDLGHRLNPGVAARLQARRQRRQPGAVDRVGARAPRQQDAHRLGLGRGRGLVQGGVARRVRGVNVGAQVQQDLDLAVPAGRMLVQGRPSPGVGRLKIGALPDQPADQRLGRVIEAQRRLLAVPAPRIPFAGIEDGGEHGHVARLQQGVEVLGQGLLLRLRHGRSLSR